MIRERIAELFADCRRRNSPICSRCNCNDMEEADLILTAIVEAAEEGMPQMTMEWRNELMEEWMEGQAGAKWDNEEVPVQFDMSFEEYVWKTYRQAYIDYFRKQAKGGE